MGEAPEGGWRNLYGRRKGKRLRAGQEQHLETTLVRYTIPGVERGGPELDLAALTGGRETWLEIGFGSGEHMLAEAAAHPDITILGCETFISGVAKLTARMDREETERVLIHPGDVRDLIDQIPAGAIQRAFLLYPDP